MQRRWRWPCAEDRQRQGLAAARDPGGVVWEHGVDVRRQAVKCVARLARVHVRRLSCTKRDSRDSLMSRWAQCVHTVNGRAEMAHSSVLFSETPAHRLPAAQPFSGRACPRRCTETSLRLALPHQCARAQAAPRAPPHHASYHSLAQASQPHSARPPARRKVDRAPVATAASTLRQAPSKPLHASSFTTPRRHD